MSRKILFVFLLSGILLGCSLAANDTSSENPVIIPTTIPTTTEASTTTSSTSAPTEKTTTEVTTTPKATTTSPTTTNTTTTTTEAPPAPPKPTPSPLPTPVLPWPQNVGTWSLSSVENTTCILMKGALQLTVPYAVPNTNTTKVAHVDVPINATVSGTCGEVAQILVLTWEAEKGSSDTNELTFTFVFHPKTNKSEVNPNKFALQSVTGEVFLPKETNITEPSQPIALEGLDTYQTSANKSFKCESEEILKNKDGKGVQVKIAHVQIEAFRTTSDTKFGPAVECELDGAVADIVPIAVGISLAALVVIVLIAYLIGRRRSRARGYQSV